MTKIQYISDLHLEISDNKKWMAKNPIEPVADILILAGDITRMEDYYYSDKIFDYFSNNWKLVIMIPGNHEYYYTSHILEKTKINKKIRENVILVNNNIIKYKDINFICTTLWTYLNPVDEYFVTKGMNDFRVIKYKTKNNIHNLNSLTYNQLHLESKDFLLKSLNKTKNQKNIVVTHHAPTELLTHDCYKNSLINKGFVVELFDYIHDYDINYWIYGHTHTNIDKEINGTKVISNQLGYIHEKLKYKPTKKIKL